VQQKPTQTSGRPQKELLIGVSGVGVMHTDPSEFDIDARFRMVKEAGVFDYLDRTPPPADVLQYRRAVEKFGVPLVAGGFYYALGRDESLLEWHLRLGRDFGTHVHNVQILTHDVEGRPVTDDQVTAAYLRAAEVGEEVGVTPCLEVHVNMWSEHFGRIQRVAEAVERRGVKFNMTLDPSHVIFKIDNPEAQAVQGLRSDVEAGRVELDPFKPGNVIAQWLQSGYVRHAHARAAAPNGPANIWMLGADGKPGRGIQYPFVRPRPGEWHSEWDEAKLEPWKEVFRQWIRHQFESPDGGPVTISTEYIPFPDYGGGAKYSIFEQNIACAEWLRGLWTEASSSAPC
jgi:hypothetical protein